MSEPIYFVHFNGWHPVVVLTNIMFIPFISLAESHIDINKYDHFHIEINDFRKSLFKILQKR